MTSIRAASDRAKGRLMDWCESEIRAEAAERIAAAIANSAPRACTDPVLLTRMRSLRKVRAGAEGCGDSAGVGSVSDLAAVIRAHADPALDAWPQLGPVSPCGCCGSGLPQRHRVVDAIADMLAAGEDAGDVAAEYAVPVEAVEAVGAWAQRWPETRR